MVTAKDVPPGGAGEVKAAFKTKGYSGPVQKTVTVETNDPGNRTVRLTVKGKVTSEVDVTPRYVNFGTVQKAGPRNPVELRIECRKDRNIRIQEVGSESPAILVSQVREDESGAVYAVSLAEKVPVGRVTGEIRIRTTGKKTPEVKVPVHALVQGSVKVAPQLLSLGSVAPGTRITRQLVVTKAGQESFRVQEVKSTTDRLSFEVVAEQEGERYRVEVTYDPGDQKTGRIAERLTLILSNGEEERIEVPVYGTFRGQVQGRTP